MWYNCNVLIGRACVTCVCFECIFNPENWGWSWVHNCTCPRDLLGLFFYGFVCVRGVCMCVFCAPFLLPAKTQLPLWTQGCVLVHSCLFYRSIRTFIEGLCVKGVHVNSCVFCVYIQPRKFGWSRCGGGMSSFFNFLCTCP